MSQDIHHTRRAAPGKGSVQRGTSAGERRRFEEGYDRIFGGPKPRQVGGRGGRGGSRSR